MCVDLMGIYINCIWSVGIDRWVSHGKYVSVWLANSLWEYYLGNDICVCNYVHSVWEYNGWVLIMFNAECSIGPG